MANLAVPHKNEEFGQEDFSDESVHKFNIQSTARVKDNISQRDQGRPLHSRTKSALM